MIKAIYSIFLALLIALFVGLGIDVFYPGPEAPDYPSEYFEDQPDGAVVRYDEGRRKEYEEAFDVYQEERSEYVIVVSVISFIFSVVILLLSLAFDKKLKVIANGLVLGSVFVLIYSIIRGFEGDSAIFRFLIVTFGLVIALIIGYMKFIRGGEEKTKMKKKKK